MTYEFYDYLKDDESTQLHKEMVKKQGWESNRLLMGYRRFNPIRFGEIRLSVQASVFHYCQPKETFDNPTIYSSMEVGVFDENGFIDVCEDKRFKDFGFIDCYWEAESSPGVYSYVDVHFVEHLFQYLKGVYWNERTELRGISETLYGNEE